MTRRKAAVILAVAWILWGALVDMNGLPVVDQVIVASILTVVAFIVEDK